MEKAATLLSIGTAGAFLCSALYLLGKLAGLHRLDLLPYLTFSDFVNFTPTTFLLNGVGFGIWLWNDRKLARGLRTASTSISPKHIPHFYISLILLVAVLIIGALVWIGWSEIAFVATFSLIFTWLAGILAVYGDKTFGTGATKLLDAYLALLFIALVTGYWITPAAMKYAPATVIMTENGRETGKLAMAMDRGLALVSDTGYRIIPWEKVRQISSSDSASEQKTVPQLPKLPASGR